MKQVALSLECSFFLKSQTAKTVKNENSNTRSQVEIILRIYCGDANKNKSVE